jgi:drug/metabolite transporter (DMT)-like permease
LCSANVVCLARERFAKLAIDPAIASGVRVNDECRLVLRGDEQRLERRASSEWRQFESDSAGTAGFRREPTMGYVFIALTVLLTGYGQIILKYEINSVANIPSGWPMMGFLLKFMLYRPLVLSGFFSGVLAAFAWMAALSKFELSYAYPFMSLNFVFVVALSFLLFGEGMHIYKLIGLALICLGVLFVSNAPITPQQPKEARQLATVAATTSAPSHADSAE